MTADTLGIIFPLVPQHIQRFFEEGKTVFVKFCGKQVAPRRIRQGSKLFFYESKSNQEVVGEARIVQIESGTLDEVSAKFGSQLFLTRPELEAYAGDRAEKRMLVLVLEKPTRYAAPLKLERPLTMAGQYMTKTLYGKLRAS